MTRKELVFPSWKVMSQFLPWAVDTVNKMHGHSTQHEPSEDSASDIDVDPINTAGPDTLRRPLG